MVAAHAVYIYSIIEFLYKIKPKNSTRIELQHLSTKQHFGNWIMGLLEYKLAPNWFWSVQDLYNYGHPNQPHYMSLINISEPTRPERLFDIEGCV